MAWEWVGAAGATIVGLAGIGATYLSGKRQVAAARAVAQDQAEAAMKAQREERHQRRIEAAYTTLLDVVGEGTLWLTHLARIPEPERRGQKLPQSVKEIVNHGPLNAVWSPVITDITFEWASAIAAVETFTDFDFSTTDMSSKQKRVTKDIEHRLIRAKAEAMVTAEKIQEQVWRELRGDDDGFRNQG